MIRALAETLFEQLGNGLGMSADKKEPCVRKSLGTERAVWVPMEQVCRSAAQLLKLGRVSCSSLSGGCGEYNQDGLWVSAVWIVCFEMNEKWRGSQIMRGGA